MRECLFPGPQSVTKVNWRQVHFRVTGGCFRDALRWPKAGIKAGMMKPVMKLVLFLLKFIDSSHSQLSDTHEPKQSKYQWNI